MRQKQKQMGLGLSKPDLLADLSCDELQVYWPLSDLSRQMSFVECVESDLFFTVFKLEVKARFMRGVCGKSNKTLSA